MKTTANGMTAAQVNNNENKNRVNNIAMPAGEYGDLCYDYFGKSSVIVFGNTADHAAQLEAMGGKYSDRLRYSALQNGRKWTEKQGRTRGYYFTTEESKGEAVKYVQRVNHAIFDKYEQSTAGMEGVIQKPADFKAGNRVRTIHGLGTVTEHTPKYNAAQSVCVKLDKSTYNYGWKGMPQYFIECRCDEITRYTEALEISDLTEQYAQRISGATAKQPRHFAMVCYKQYEKMESYLRIIYNNREDNSQGTTYYLAQYDKTISEHWPDRGSEENLTLEQAAAFMARFDYYTAHGLTLKEIWKKEAA